MSNSLDADQVDDLSGLIWVQTVCQDYQQTTLVDKGLTVHNVLANVLFVSMLASSLIMCQEGYTCT